MTAAEIITIIAATSAAIVSVITAVNQSHNHSETKSTLATQVVPKLNTIDVQTNSGMALALGRIDQLELLVNRIVKLSATEGEAAVTKDLSDKAAVSSLRAEAAEKLKSETALKL